MFSVTFQPFYAVSIVSSVKFQFYWAIVSQQKQQLYFYFPHNKTLY